MRSYVQPGNTIPLTAPYAVAGGEGLLVGALFGIATGTAALGGLSRSPRRVFDVKKAASQAWSVGDKVYWYNHREAGHEDRDL